VCGEDAAHIGNAMSLRERGIGTAIPRAVKDRRSESLKQVEGLDAESFLIPVF